MTVVEKDTVSPTAASKEVGVHKGKNKAGLVRPPTAGEFASQSIIMCYLTDFLDIPISYLWQKKKDKEKSSTWTEIIVGEFGGDILGGVMMWASEKLFPSGMRALSKGLGFLLDPLYAVAGKVALKDWAKQNAIANTSQEFKTQLKEWKAEQKLNLGRSVVLFSGTIVGNVWMQRLIGSQASYRNMAEGKIWGILATAALTLGLRGFAPRFSHKIDEKLNKLSDPIMKAVTGKDPRKQRKEELKELRREINEDAGVAAEKNPSRFTDLVTAPAADHRGRVENETPATAAGVAA